ncbi:glycerophosphodiester phosphodiesterase family protein [Tautonia sp. JC769]|uniref:glycerophosphodiester phosphodiesterase n=1 Tax=Tautonia sp. JC769 TaxID=3232135 RepID=UPI00345A9D6D
MTISVIGIIPLILGCVITEEGLDAGTMTVGHRGLLNHAPENSLAGFRACVDLRVGFELDVRRTNDGALVCLHDESVDRTTDGTGAVEDYSLARITSLDAGAWFDPAFAGESVPMLDEVFRLLGGVQGDRILVAVDLKDDDTTMAEDVVGMARRMGVLDRLVFIGLAIDRPDLRRRIRDVDSRAHVASLAESPAAFEAALVDPDADWVYVRSLPTSGQVDRVHAMGKRIFLAGPKVAGLEPSNWRLAAQSGVDAVLTDFPLEFRSTLRAGHRDQSARDGTP